MYSLHVKHGLAMVEVLRRSGDAVLFALVFRLLQEYNVGKGPAPCLYEGQVLPQLPKFSGLPPPVDVPMFDLDGAGRKRKAEEL